MPSARRRRRRASSSGAWTPQSDASLVFDLNPDLITGVEGDQVVSFVDAQSTVTFTRFTASQGGELRLGRTEANGHAAVQFVSANDDFYAAVPVDQSARFPSAATICIVAEPNSDIEYSLYEHQGRDLWWRYSDGNTYHGVFRTVRVTTAGVSPSTGVHYWVGRSSASGFTMRLDGAQIVSAAASYEAGNRHRIGFQSTGLQAFNGWMYRIMAFSSHMSDADVTGKLEPYIRTKYNLS